MSFVKSMANHNLNGYKLLCKKFSKPCLRNKPLLVIDSTGFLYKFKKVLQRNGKKIFCDIPMFEYGLLFLRDIA